MSNTTRALSNIVYMGMGEPLLNYRNVLESVERITGTPGLAMSPKRITVSTAGIAKAIKRLGDDEVKFNLALSLARRERRQAQPHHGHQRDQQPCGVGRGLAAFPRQDRNAAHV